MSWPGFGPKPRPRPAPPVDPNAVLQLAESLRPAVPVFDEPAAGRKVWRVRRRFRGMVGRHDQGVGPVVSWFRLMTEEGEHYEGHHRCDVGRHTGSWHVHEHADA